MKKYILFALAVVSGPAIFAQTALPYTTGFENANEKAGWVEYRIGTTAHYNWSYALVGGASGPACLSHDYPVGASGNDTTNDWFVSPGFSFTTGALMSFKIKVYSIMGATTPADEIAVYLLTGSNNPAVATKTKLGSMRDMVSSGTAWMDKTGLVIPATSGTSYLAFQYQAVSNWFTITLDDIQVSTATGIGSMAQGDLVGVYPNPAQDITRLRIASVQPETSFIQLFASDGKMVFARNYELQAGVNLVELPLADLPAGVYSIACHNTAGTAVKRLVKQ